MNFFLAKTDPQTYSLADLQRDKSTLWDGVKNAQAVQAIAAMRPGDKVFIYHSQGESAIVGLAKVESAPIADPNNPKSKVVQLRFIQTLDPPVTLHEVKESGRFKDFLLVRNSRLSTMACPEDFVDWLRKRYPKAKF